MDRPWNMPDEAIPVRLESFHTAGTSTAYQFTSRNVGAGRL